MHTSNCIYHDGQHELHGFLAYDKRIDTARPAVLIAPDWSGRSEQMCHKAQLLADMGYLGFALDMYGSARLGTSDEEKRALMTPLMNDRTLLLQRLKAAYDTVVALPEVDSKRVAIIGFCFGGLCALDLARSGINIQGAVSIHGLLHKPTDMPEVAIQAKVLVLHGYDDPLVQPKQVHDFCQEMTDAHVDWQMHMYGLVQHAFTNPQAHDTASGLIYNALAAQRAWQATSLFLQEIFTA